jgi:DNA-binding FadR family transcriptional regulator
MARTDTPTEVALIANMPTPSDSLTRQIETYIREQIRGGLFKPGEVIPRQVDLAKQFGVSQQLVHRAVRRLREQGVVEGKGKHGARASVPRGTQLDWLSLVDEDAPTDTGS